MYVASSGERGIRDLYLSYLGVMKLPCVCVIRYVLKSSRASISTKIQSAHHTPLNSSHLITFQRNECNLCSFDTAKASRLGTYRKEGRASRY